MKPIPPLPTRFLAPAGPVQVRLERDLKDSDGSAAYGLYDEATRVVRVDPTLTPLFQWHTYFHEWAHAALMDAGVGNLFTADENEALCDAIATARLREKFG